MYGRCIDTTVSKNAISGSRLTRGASVSAVVLAPPCDIVPFGQPRLVSISIHAATKQHIPIKVNAHTLASRKSCHLLVGSNWPPCLGEVIAIAIIAVGITTNHKASPSPALRRIVSNRATELARASKVCRLNVTALLHEQFLCRRPHLSQSCVCASCPTEHGSPTLC